ncbi:hypothetical protein HY374_01695 [Candidatus Berkelbacteria bacterium]|nr:hypothetical protein [Candidatus Berkelbacteria bacterium]
MAERKKKEVTNEDLARSIEQLARMTQEGFLEMGKKFEDIDKQFVQNRKEHAEMLWKLSETVTRNEHHALDRRVTALESARA